MKICSGQAVGEAPMRARAVELLDRELDRVAVEGGRGSVATRVVHSSTRGLRIQTPEAATSGAVDPSGAWPRSRRHGLSVNTAAARTKDIAPSGLAGLGARRSRRRRPEGERRSSAAKPAMTPGMCATPCGVAADGSQRTARANKAGCAPPPGSNRSWISSRWNSRSGTSSNS
jgi:hypothetical protein